MDAEVETLCGAGYGEVRPERVNSRNGYRARERDTRAGTVELAIPKLRHGPAPALLRQIAVAFAEGYRLSGAKSRVGEHGEERHQAAAAAALP